MKPTLAVLRPGGFVVSNVRKLEYVVGALVMAGKPVDKDSKQWRAFIEFTPRSVWITERLADGTVKVEL